MFHRIDASDGTILIGTTVGVGNGKGNRVGSWFLELMKGAVSIAGPAIAKIPEMNDISKPRLPIGIQIFRKVMSTDDYRKNFSFFQGIFVLLPNLTR